MTDHIETATEVLQSQRAAMLTYGFNNICGILEMEMLEVL